MRTDTAHPIQLSDYTAPDFNITKTELDFDLYPQATRVTARLMCERRGAASTPLVLMGERLKLIYVKLDGALLSETDYVLSDEALTLKNVPDRFTLETLVEIDPLGNLTLEGLYMSSGRYCTQCEAEGFRKITYYLDRPDALSKYQVRIEAPKAGFAHLLSNGNLLETGDIGDDRHYALWEDPYLKPCYLFAVVAGDLDVYEDSLVTLSGRTIALKIFVDTGMKARAVYAMDALKRAMQWDEQVYGLEYDLDLFMIVAVRDFNFGAMENKGLNVFNASLLLADPTTATDMDYERIESVIAHEYFHNWSGNRVTCRDWFQLCLKEGLTVFRDQSFSADQRGHAVARIKDVRALRARQFPEDSGPLAHPARPTAYVKIDNFYTATIYEKGAEIVGMLKTYAGPALYRKVLDHYFKTNDGTAATLEDFLASFTAVSGEDFLPWLQWYQQAGTPQLQVTSFYDATAQTLTMNLSQKTAPTPGQPDKVALPIPVRFGLLTTDGEQQMFSVNGQYGAESLYILREASAEITLNDVTSPPVLSILRHFSAPVVLNVDEPSDHAFARFKGDVDPFNRWEAAQKLSRDIMLSSTPDAAHIAAQTTDYAEALKACLLDGDLDDAFKALILGLPTESDLAQSLSPIDPAFIHHNRKAFKAALSHHLHDTLKACYQALPVTETFTPDAVSAGRRALRNALLDMLMAGYATTSQKTGLADMAEAHFAAASNMTDMIGGLMGLSYIQGAAYQKALDEFYARFQNEPLVIDKWFALQAGSAQAATPIETLERVRALSEHPDFDIRTPNRWRALVQGFANNQSVFHMPDGSGYAFLVEQILLVDAFNPMTAARVIEPLSRYRFYASPYFEAMRAALETLIQTPDLSKNALELASKALDD